MYRGVLRRSRDVVAIKRIDNDGTQGMREFVAEVASLGRLRHRNLVELRGCCKRGQDLLLVYEFMPNGSLDAHLFGKPSPSSVPLLSWEQRVRIIRGVASGLGVPARGVGAGGGAPRREGQQRAPRCRHERAARRLWSRAPQRARGRPRHDAHRRDAGLHGPRAHCDRQGHHGHRRVRLRRAADRGSLQAPAHRPRHRRKPVALGP
jgi:hypothetical protein